MITRYLLCCLLTFFPVILFAQNDLTPQQKVEKISKQIEKEPENIVLYNNRADAYLQMSDVPSAMADLNKIVELYKASPEEKAKELVAVAYLKLSETKLKEEEAAPALTLIAGALKLFPREKTYMLHEARVLAAMPDKHEMAQQKFDNLVVTFGDDEQILMEYAKFLLPTEPAKAVVLLEKVLRLNVMNKKALSALGKHYKTIAAEQTDKSLKSVYREKAIGYYELLYTIDPEEEGLRTSLKELYTTQGRTADLEKLK